MTFIGISINILTFIKAKSEIINRWNAGQDGHSFLLSWRKEDKWKKQKEQKKLFVSE